MAAFIHGHKEESWHSADMAQQVLSQLHWEAVTFTDINRCAHVQLQACGFQNSPLRLSPLMSVMVCWAAVTCTDFTRRAHGRCAACTVWIQGPGLAYALDASMGGQRGHVLGPMAAAKGLLHRIPAGQGASCGHGSCGSEWLNRVSVHGHWDLCIQGASM